MVCGKNRKKQLASCILAWILPAGYRNTLGYAFESTQQKKKPTWQGLVDGHSLSNETDWRRGFSCSTTLSSALRGFRIGRALLKTGGDGKPVSDEEETSANVHVA